MINSKKFFMILATTLMTMGIALGISMEVQADSTPLSVKAILPENQFNKEVSYYHLMMKPGAKQTIELQLFNSSDQETTALVTLTAATTNNTGVIDYNLPDKEIDKSLVYPFTTIATSPKEVKIPANSDVTTPIEIEMPVEEYDGMILGGINVKVKKAKEKETDKKASGGMKIENEMNYSIGVVLVENENKVKTDMLLERVFADQVMGNNTTKVALQNPTATPMEDVSFEAKIYAKNSDTVLYESKQEGYRMAPNSTFDFGIAIGNERYKAGEYRLKLVAKSEPKNPKDGEPQSWDFDVPFTVTRAQADKLNETAVDLPADYTLWFIIGGVSLLVVIAGISVMVIMKKKKKQKELQKKKLSKKQSPSKRRKSR